MRLEPVFSPRDEYRRPTPCDLRFLALYWPLKGVIVPETFWPLATIVLFPRVNTLAVGGVTKTPVVFTVIVFDER